MILLILYYRVTPDLDGKRLVTSLTGREDKSNKNKTEIGVQGRIRFTEKHRKPLKKVNSLTRRVMKYC